MPDRRPPPDESTPEADSAAEARATRGLSMATWLGTAVLLVTIVSVVASSGVTMTHAASLAEDVLYGRSRARLALQAAEIERHLSTSLRQSVALAGSGTAIEASRRFEAAFAELADLPPSRIDAAADEVDEFYRDEFAPELERVTGHPVPASRLRPTDDAGVYLQRWYTVPAPDDGVLRREVVDAGDGSTWSEVHAELHPVLDELATRLGFADLYLVTPDTRTIVYSVAKAPDFATNLAVGPASGSILAQAVREAGQRAPDEPVVLTDLAAYGPYGGRPAGFIATPVRDGDELVAVLAVALGVEEIDGIMTVGGQWEQAGFGETGETFLAGGDGRMRSIARGFVEDRDGYLAAAAEAGSATAAERRAMAATGTTIVHQRAIDDEDLAALAAGELVERPNWLGRDVVTASEPLDVAGLDWSVVTEVERSEVVAPIVDFRSRTLIAIAILVAVVALVMVPWARRVFRPLRAVSDRLTRAHRGEDTPPTVVGPHDPAEFAELADSVDRMIASLTQQQAEVEAAIAERRDTLRALLPPAIARRVDAGDRHVVDEIQQASVVVLLAEGIGTMRGTSSTPRELLSQIVDELDTLAERHGLDRVKLLGDAYYAGCGLERPVLDHAPRAVTFARAARDIVGEVAAEAAVELRLSGGVHSGPVTVGLAGSVLLLYDIWGDTVGGAELLAQAASPGEVLVSGSTRAMLPPDVSTVPRETPAGPAWQVAGGVAEEAPT